MRVQASAMAQFLGYPLVGGDMPVDGPCAISDPVPDTVLFANKYSSERAMQLNGLQRMFVVAAEGYRDKLSQPHVLSPNPRLDFARILEHFFEPELPASIAPTAQIPASATIGKDVTIGHYCVIGEHVSIGDGTVLEHHVVIADRCMIGKRCWVRSNTVIGGKGYGFERDDEGTPVRIPHLGNVVVGDDVEIGACTSIARGTLGSTTVCDHAKIDDHVFIAHNAYIGEKSMVIAHAEVSGSVRLGKRVWIGPCACVLNGVTLDDDAYVGIGAVVIRNVEKGTTVVGNPAKPLPKKNPG